MNNNNSKDYFLVFGLPIIGGIVLMLAVLILASSLEPQSAVYIEEHELTDTLSDWQVLQLALIEVESNYDSDAISDKEGRGILQLTPIYIEEVNRLHDTDYGSLDAHNDTISLLCFRATNWKKNPNFDLDRAIKIHNPQAGAWYRERIIRKIKEIKRREQLRRLIINL